MGRMAKLQKGSGSVQSSETLNDGASILVLTVWKFNVCSDEEAGVLPFTQRGGGVGSSWWQRSRWWLQQ